ncbi:LysE family transporter [Cohnella hashimotonis]|uniref:LysE family transporter n=1 Tax=Cohnella hashimotonis TaxID=2826895 RepID=A0ABT6TJ38_9BACL|nr:LysE family transporter [Cohnella hashimotonis]MDI4646864.1 LysE family transporter [Cohnella hashimotonis]
MNVFISHMLLGLSLAAPIGPMNAAQMDRGVRSGFWHAWLIGLGGTMADCIFMLLVYFGIIHFLGIPFMQTFLWLFGFLVLAYMGVESIANARKSATRRSEHKEAAVKSLAAGFFMSLFNPLSILFWLGIYGSVLADMIAKYEAREVFLYSAAVLAGIMLWDVFMALLASSFRQLLTPGLLTAISVASGLSLIGFGIYFGLEAYHALFG